MARRCRTAKGQFKHCPGLRGLGRVRKGRKGHCLKRARTGRCMKRAKR